MATLGQELKQQREACGKSLEEISRVTNIAVRFLQAIERDDYRELPGELYNRSFLRQLSRAIGYDEARAMQLYERQSGSPRIPTDEEISRAPEFLSPPKTGNALLLTLTFSVAAIVIAGTSYAFPGWWNFLRRPSLPSQQPSSLPAPSHEPPAVTTTPDLAPVPTNELVLELRATGKCWTRIQVDSNKQEEFILLPDDVRLYRAKEKIVLSLGARQAVSVTVNGRPLTLPSQDGITVKRVVITPSTLETELMGRLSLNANLQ
ncbi:MAG: helix-turn-helix domain-containing protein [Acidobacteriota bacterium]